MAQIGVDDWVAQSGGRRDQKRLLRVERVYALLVDRDDRMAQGPRPCEDKSGEPQPPLYFARRLGETRLKGGAEPRFIEEKMGLGLL